MAGKIFINYRREDSQADARSVYQRLQRTFGNRQLFMDVDTIEKGRDFREVLHDSLSECQLMLVILGRSWLGVRNDQGTRRLDDPNDFVRMEIAAALKRNIPVIPVRVGGAPMPSEAELPDNLQALARRQSAIVTHENFPHDMDGLEQDIRKIVKRSTPWRLLVPALALLAVGVGAALYQFGLSEPPPADVAGTPAPKESDAGTLTPGRDYTHFYPTPPVAETCKSACIEKDRCLSWSYEPNGPCWLIYSYAARNIVTAPGAVSGNKIEIGKNLQGLDYTHVLLDEPKPELCLKACLDDGKCRAWTYVQPGAQIGAAPGLENKAFCWLKDDVPNLTPDPVAVSGVMRRK